MDYSKLLLAVEVRKLAATLYADERAIQKVSAKESLDFARWNAQHSVMSFVPAALEQLNQIATMITPPQP
jgi:hypothetical protein